MHDDAREPLVTGAKLRRLPVQVLVVAAGDLLYSAGRALAARHHGRAYHHAQSLWDLERTLHLPDERHLQHLMLHSDTVVRIANFYYGHVHFPLTFVLLGWLFFRDGGVYRWVRNALLVSFALALVVLTAYPMAPPRLMPQLGFVDTAAQFGQSVYGSPDADHLTDQFASMPSLHVGWALLMAVGMIMASRTRWRWLWVLHPVATFLVVVGTGNHYEIDAVAGVLIVLAGLALGRPRVAKDTAAPRRSADDGALLGR